MSFVCDPVEDKKIMSELSSCSSNKSVISTPIKLLIAHEMSKEMDSKHNSPGLVAKLMGLDALPRQEPDSVFLQKGHSQHYCHTEIPSSYWQQDVQKEMQIPREVHSCSEQTEYKDVYEVFSQSHQGSYTRSKSPQKGKHNEIQDEKKMALVREKFIEAKRLTTDKKLPQPKRLQDALEVLNTNRELFVNFLQEPNSLISQHQFDLPSLPPTETKRITVLKPSKLIESTKLFQSQKNEKQTTPNWRFVDDPTQPTRIVVLKPSNNKLQDIKAVVSPPSLSPRNLHSNDYFEEPEADDAEKSREVNGHRRDDTLLSSVFSNGYIGDESSFHKSESGYVLGNLSDSEVVSPVSRHSWDYIHRGGSPFSTSSFGRASCSPESSVCREAKRRLLERWATVASNGSFVEQPKHARKSSSTLGEMLALSNPKSSSLSDEGTSKEQEARGSTSCLINEMNRDENLDNSPTNLTRSKSLPVSAAMLGNPVNLQVSNPDVGKTDATKEMVKSKSLKTSLKNIFWRSKRSGKGKASASQSHDECDRSLESTSDSVTLGANEIMKEDGFSHYLQTLSKKPSLPGSDEVEAEHRIIFPEAGLSEAKPTWLRNPKDNQDEPSPISVLEQLFEEEDYTKTVPFSAKLYDNGANLLSNSSRSSLIDKSPPIGSISRTLSRDNSCLDRRTDYALSPPPLPTTRAEGEHEWHFYVQSLLLAAGLGGEAQPDSYIARWHSPDSPLDPTLRDRYIDINEKEITHEGKRRRIRSTKKLVFDCVNEVLGEVTGHEPNNGVHERILEVEMVGRVWTQMREWFSAEMRCDDGDWNSLVLERVVRNEVVEKGRAEQIKVEMDNIGNEIEGKLLEELVHDVVAELTGR